MTCVFLLSNASRDGRRWLKNDLSRNAFCQRTTGKWLHKAKKLMFGGKDLLKRKSGFFRKCNRKPLFCFDGGKFQKHSLFTIAAMWKYLQKYKKWGASRVAFRHVADICVPNLDALWIESSWLKGWLMPPFQFSAHSINNLFAARLAFAKSKQKFYVFLFFPSNFFVRFSSRCFIDIICKRILHGGEMADVEDWCSIEPHESPKRKLY